MTSTTAAFSSDQPVNTTLVLSTCIVAGSQFVIDLSLLPLIAPAVGRDFGATAGQMSLVAALFTVTLAAFILAGGTFGDIYGRRRFLTIGVLVEGMMALCAMFAPNIAVLSVIRAVAGIGGALISPLTIALISANFQGEGRSRALGTYFGFFGLTGGFSIILVQLLNQFFGWRATFSLVILMALISLTLLRMVPESSTHSTRRVDWLGIALAGVGLVLFVLGVNRAGNPAGFASPTVYVPLLIAVFALVAFFVYESRHPDPALQVSLFKNPFVVVGTLMAFFTFFCESSITFHLNLYLQSILHISPLRTALYILPLGISSFVVSVLNKQLSSRFSMLVIVVAAFLSMLLGSSLLAFTIGPDVNFWLLLLPMLLLGAGLVIINTLRTTLIVGSAPTELSGSASALSNATTNLGTALGIALPTTLLTSLISSSYARLLSQEGVSSGQISRSVELFAHATQANAGNIAARNGVTAPQLQQITSAYLYAYQSSLSLLYWLVTLLLGLTALTVYLLLRRARRTDSASIHAHTHP